MTPLFWISLTWVLATVVVMRLPVHQRFLPGALLMLTAVPILLSIGFQVGWLMALLGLAAVASLFPNLVHFARARYRGEEMAINANVLRYLVIPGEI